MTYIIDQIDATELAKYMLNIWASEIDLDDLRTEIYRLLECEANGKTYRFKNTPSNDAVDIIQDIITAGDFEFEEA